MTKENGDQDKPLSKEILRLLSEKPGIKSREIAESLDAEKSNVDTLLYGVLKSKCFQDQNYLWYLEKDAPKETPKKRVVEKNKLSDLINYYLECLSQDDDGYKVGTFARNKYGKTDYVELEELPSSDSDSIFNNTETQSLISKIKRGKGRLQMYFGYPNYLHKVQKQNKEEFFIISPLFFYPIDIQDNTYTLSDNIPIFNLTVLKNITGLSNEQAIDELVHLEDELGLNSEHNIPELDDLVQRLHNIRPEWPWREEISPSSLSSEDKFQDIEKTGIYNKALLLIGERSPFTQGLESELRTLSEISEEEYQNTALGQWLDLSSKEKDENPNNTEPLLEVLPLNTEQRKAVDLSLTENLTVVTGPPGTGKSQVVTDLVINAAWRGKKILFASKNNKAVDVVESRINNLGTRPFLLRTGSRNYQRNLAEYLVGLLTTTVTEHDKSEYKLDQESYKELEKNLERIQEEENTLIEQRNKVDSLSKKIEGIREESGEDIFDGLKKINLNEYSDFLDEFEVRLDDTIREYQNIFIRLFWKRCKNKRYEYLNSYIPEILSFAKKLGISSVPKEIKDNNIAKWVNLYEDFENKRKWIKNIQKYLKSIKKLQKLKSLEDLASEQIALILDMSENALKLWKGWLKLQPDRLSEEDRTLLNRYNALLKIVLDTQGDLYNNLGKRSFFEYQKLSEKISHLLPAWAVTSLSARGKIPFQAGYFDLVVFDEASQCDIASALPLLYRAKRAVIIGDPMQLSHITSLRKGYDQQLLEKYNLVSDFATWAYSYNSLFDLATSVVNGENMVNLRDHHRSHADIIEFSNQEFYEGYLRIASKYENLNLVENEDNAVKWVDIRGEVSRPNSGSALNKKEAESVVNEVKKLVFESSYKGSIGVVTPFRAQVGLIDRLISQDLELSEALLKHDFLVETVHKFQGDERDVMIFSPVVSKNIQQGALSFLQNTGNLFNVAITRARAFLLVVGDISAISKCGVKYLEHFAQYVKNLEKTEDIKKEKVPIKFNSKYPTVSNPENVSEWERMFYNALFISGIKTIPQYQVEMYTLDFALFDNERKLNIEIDGERYHKDMTGELCKRDQIRNQRLYELGWDVQRFWVYEVRDDLEGCIKKIKNWINEGKAKENKSKNL
jgi:superfamily I DNA and/or RNA helicase/very-short-patch-repair endonuclease